ncbi:hypothetical protein HZQ14_15750 [Elizabethkingia anophelis]|uniref:hypothetical protein n=1 Tax=Elizabethkingia anophelis TaxID=1117645 RepID=UPI0021A69BCD|nr:hypothetical protein [Elizabethkingia anophelis]
MNNTDKLIESFCADLRNELRNAPSNSKRLTKTIMGHIMDKYYERYFTADVKIDRANNISINNIKCHMLDNEGVPYYPDFKIDTSALINKCKEVLKEKRTGQVYGLGGKY